MKSTLKQANEAEKLLQELGLAQDPYYRKETVLNKDGSVSRKSMQQSSRICRK